MNIAQLLKEALSSGDWNFVAEAYYMLSGEKVDPMESDALSLLSIILEKIQDITDEKPKKKKPVKKTKPKVEKKELDNSFSLESNKPSRKVVAKNTGNKFELMQDAIAEAGNENGYDKINDNVKPSQRNRKSYSTKNVVCIDCNKSFDVNPLFAKENYICDNCLQRRGR